MTDKNSTPDQLAQIVELYADELQGMPMFIDRPGKEDFVLVSAATYNGLISRIYDLEEQLKTDDERAAEESDLLAALDKAQS